MKKLLFICFWSFLLFSCSSDDSPEIVEEETSQEVILPNVDGLWELDSATYDFVDIQNVLFTTQSTTATSYLIEVTFNHDLENAQTYEFEFIERPNDYSLEFRTEIDYQGQNYYITGFNFTDIDLSTERLSLTISDVPETQDLFRGGVIRN
ncbi:hypothetical protein OZ410_10115 [Robiginitalea sp. M366]|uniref:hypothetical protein n=1 Tax=Robiginitalea aestuariiviva TaxID=3036903 RepID=UPI00240D5E74|nr:hypothetical protein [Robiginitalea aestuariiviva]MDG1572669.1 hypothetical protein [Robiginitalea aestuariiviva]